MFDYEKDLAILQEEGYSGHFDAMNRIEHFAKKQTSMQDYIRALLDRETALRTVRNANALKRAFELCGAAVIGALTKPVRGIEHSLLMAENWAEGMATHMKLIIEKGKEKETPTTGNLPPKHCIPCYASQRTFSDFECPIRDLVPDTLRECSSVEIIGVAIKNEVVISNPKADWAWPDPRFYVTETITVKPQDSEIEKDEFDML